MRVRGQAQDVPRTHHRPRPKQPLPHFAAAALRQVAHALHAQGHLRRLHLRIARGNRPRGQLPTPPLRASHPSHNARMRATGDRTMNPWAHRKRPKDAGPIAASAPNIPAPPKTWPPTSATPLAANTPPENRQTQPKRLPQIPHDVPHAVKNGFDFLKSRKKPHRVWPWSWP